MTPYSFLSTFVMLFGALLVAIGIVVFGLLSIAVPVGVYNGTHSVSVALSAGYGVVIVAVLVAAGLLHLMDRVNDFMFDRDYERFNRSD